MKLSIYVNFPGKCAEALDFHTKHLGVKILIKSTYGEMAKMFGPENFPSSLSAEHIIHARFQVGDTLVMASDGPPGKTAPMRSAYLTLNVGSNEEAERIYKALTDGGEVFMPLVETFFAHRIAQFRDKYGVNWMLIHEKPMEPRLSAVVQVAEFQKARQRGLKRRLAAVEASPEDIWGISVR